MKRLQAVTVTLALACVPAIAAAQDVPDAHDVEHQTYAAAKSPKYMGRFPFTVESGQRLTDAMLAAIGAD